MFAKIRQKASAQAESRVRAFSFSSLFSLLLAYAEYELQERRSFLRFVFIHRCIPYTILLLVHSLSSLPLPLPLSLYHTSLCISFRLCRILPRHLSDSLSIACSVARSIAFCCMLLSLPVNKNTKKCRWQWLLHRHT